MTDLTLATAPLGLFGKFKRVIITGDSMSVNAIILAGLVAIGWITSASLIDIVGAVTGLVSVWLAARENIWTYPVGLVNIVAFFIEFYTVKLYADATLQVVFFVLTVVGWVIWLTKRQGHKVRPTRNARRTELLIAMPIVAIGTVVWGQYLSTLGDPAPILDALVALLSIIAQYFLSYKVLQNWHFWISVDVLSIALYLYKNLVVTAGVYAIFLIIATGGLFAWKREMGRVRSSSAA